LQAEYPKGFDLIIDPVAADYLNKDLRLIGQDGRIVVLSMLAGRYAEKLDVALLLKKRAQLIGSTLRNQSDDYKASLIQQFYRDCGHALGAGLSPVLANVLPFEEAEQAHQLLASNALVGKVVLVWNAE